ncbi:GGDEF domain-containing protein [Tsukamurella soli]|uniref:PAS domain S-box-containing protein/diguanylate cyclase (GGDEF) domain-containing protein n=1 Tax=Tsukamurella soli TaxID=644556 RepID=A0ABP8KFA3_9ACTN
MICILAEETRVHLDQQPAPAPAPSADRLPAEVYLSLFDNSRTAMVIHDQPGRLVAANRAYADLLGYPLGELIGLTSSDVLHPEDHAHRDAEAAQEFSGHRTGAVIHRRHIRKDGSVIRLRVRKSAIHTDRGLLVLVIVDGWDAVGELEHQARHDELTGLLNRRGFRERLAVVNPIRSVRLAMIDVDGLKQVNDRYGHAAGDRLLCAVGEALLAAAPPGAVVGRWAGDEFVVCAAEPAAPADAGTLASLLRDGVGRARIAAEGRTLVPRVSVGTTTFRPASEALDAALLRADDVMYQHKAGRAPLVDRISG